MKLWSEWKSVAEGFISKYLIKFEKCVLPTTVDISPWKWVRLFHIWAGCSTHHASHVAHKTLIASSTISFFFIFLHALYFSLDMAAKLMRAVRYSGYGGGAAGLEVHFYLLLLGLASFYWVFSFFFFFFLSFLFFVFCFCFLSFMWYGSWEEGLWGGFDFLCDWINWVYCAFFFNYRSSDFFFPLVSNTKRKGLLLLIIYLFIYFFFFFLYSIACQFDSIYFFMVFSDFVFTLVPCEKGELLGLNDDPIFI